MCLVSWLVDQPTYEDRHDKQTKEGIDLVSIFPMLLRKIFSIVSLKNHQYRPPLHNGRTSGGTPTPQAKSPSSSSSTSCSSAFTCICKNQYKLSGWRSQRASDIFRVFVALNGIPKCNFEYINHSPGRRTLWQVIQWVLNGIGHGWPHGLPYNHHSRSCWSWPMPCFITHVQLMINFDWGGNFFPKCKRGSGNPLNK